MTKPRTPAFPRELAELIARKAHQMAQALEQQAMEQMVKTARQSLARGIDAPEIARQMGLVAGGTRKV
ncbi:TPA: hypothetical protein ACKP0L_005778 [Pseudomonas putida]|uniref:hypothetical protein n=1 Tax=Pseudomonas TaxID=286 RepID=UPI000B2437CE|nr:MULTISPECIES: hypothetical protein [Pseudomonas]